MAEQAVEEYVSHAEGWCPGDECSDPHHDYIRRRLGLEQAGEEEAHG